MHSLKFGMGLPYREYFFSDHWLAVRAHQKSGGFDSIRYFGNKGGVTGHEAFFEGKPIYFKYIDEICRFEDMEVYQFGFKNKYQTKYGAVNYSVYLYGHSVKFIFSDIPKDGEIEWTIPKTSLVKNVPGTRKWAAPHFDQKARILYCKVQDYRQVSRPGGLGDSMLNTYSPKLSSFEMKQDTYIAFVCTGEIIFKEDKEKYRLTCEIKKGEEIIFAIFFDGSEYEIRDRVKTFKTSPGVDKEIKVQIDRYISKAETLPEITIGEYMHLPKFFTAQPLYLESVKIGDTGSFRGASYSWVWGWDTVVTAFGLLNCGWYKEVKDLLFFLYRYRIKETGGICPLCFTQDFKPYHIQPIGNAGDLRYLMLLYRYYSYTKDINTIKKIWPFAKELFYKIAKQIHFNGLYPTRGIFPDFPEEWGRTKYDYISLESGWWYDACRSIENLALTLGEKKLTEDAKAIASRIKDNFLKVFYVPEQKFIAMAVDPERGYKYDVPFLCNLACLDSYYGQELIWDKLEEIADFCERNFLTDGGIRMIPAWEKRGFEQWWSTKHTWFTFADIFLGKTLRYAGRGVALEKIASLCDQLFAWSYTVSDGKTLFSQDTMHWGGHWISFGSRSWYSMLIEAIAGIMVDIGGINYLPCDMKLPIRLDRFPFRNTDWAIDITGKGPWVESFRVDGEELRNCLKIPLSFYKPGKHELNIIRGIEEPKTIVIIEVIGAGIDKVEERNTNLYLNLKGAGRVIVRYFAPWEVRIYWNNKSIPSGWKSSNKKGIVELIIRDKGNLWIEKIV